MVEINMTAEIGTIGGHFSAVLETRKNLLPGNYCYESARSGLFAVLKATGCQRIYIPYYVCDAVSSAIQAADCKIIFYSINETFEIADEISLRDGDLLLLVDYFGVCRTQIESQLTAFPKLSVVVDCSQAYFQSPFDCLATIYSPRKFLPVPDGGIVHTNLELEEQKPDERSSIDRYRYLLERVDAEPELSRTLYLQSESQLIEPSLRSMSSFTKKLIEVADLEFIKGRRAHNWAVLSELDEINKLDFGINGQTAICYPLMVEGAEHIREELRARRVFSPLYWPGVTCTNGHEQSLVRDTLYLPIDHRYDEFDMVRVLNILKSFT